MDKDSEEIAKKKKLFYLIVSFLEFFIFKNFPSSLLQYNLGINFLN